MKFNLNFFSLVPPWRNRFSKDYDEGLYTGTTLLLAYESVALPFSIISAALSACILYPYVIMPLIDNNLLFRVNLISFLQFKIDFER